MKIGQVPQDASEAYEGHKRAIYAVNDDGHITAVESSGWDEEVEITAQAIAELVRLRNKARELVILDEASPLLFHMYDKRMDLLTLASSVGMFQFRVKRHFKPNVFAKLNDKLLLRYCEAFGLTIDELRTLPSKETDR